MTKLLVADDQALIRDAIRRVLVSRHYAFELAKDGAQALEQINRHTGFSALVLDQRMPKVSGLEVLKHLRCGRAELPHDLPVVLITGHGDKRVVAIARSLDVDAVLAKPFTTKAFLERLDRCFTARACQQPPEAYERIEPGRDKVSDAPITRASPAAILNGKPVWISPDARDNHVSAAETESDPCRQARLMSIDQLAPGMVLAQSVYTASGGHLAGPGLELTPRLVNKLRALAEERADYRYIRVTATKAATPG